MGLYDELFGFGWSDPRGIYGNGSNAQSQFQVDPGYAFQQQQGRAAMNAGQQAMRNLSMLSGIGNNVNPHYRPPASQQKVVDCTGCGAPHRERSACGYCGRGE